MGDRFARGPEFLHYDPAILIGQEVTGSCLGIIGMGRIGKQVARRARGFEMRVLYYNRNRDEAAERELDVEYRSLDELLSESDFVSLNCPLTAETTGLISTRQFELMKPSGILLNLARGPVVDHEALYTALTTGQIAACGTDVSEPETAAPRSQAAVAGESDHHAAPRQRVEPHTGPDDADDRGESASGRAGGDVAVSRAREVGYLDGMTEKPTNVRIKWLVIATGCVRCCCPWSLGLGSVSAADAVDCRD